jgi:dipeptide/tripeptide permease
MAAASATPPVEPQTFVPDPNEPVWFGHPKGLFTCFFSEMWERFCYYGMRALLALYVAEQFTNGDQGEAGKMYGAFTGLVYALGVFGGSVADKILGYRRAIMLGGLFMAAGEFMLMIRTETMFLAGLSALIVGVGLFKPNVSTLVGKLYKPGDPRRDGGFTIFYMGINLGAFLAPILCRAVAGWMGPEGKPDYRYGFLTAGFGMLIGVVTFWRGFSHLGDKGLPPPDKKGFGGLGLVTAGCIGVVPLIYMLLEKKEFAGHAMKGLMVVILAYLVYVAVKSDRVAMQRIFALIILLLLNIVFWASFEQAGNSLNFFARDQVKLKSAERFPLGGTRGFPVEVTPTTVTLDAEFKREETTTLAITYPSKENVNKRLDASAEIPAGTYAARTPIPAVLVDKDKRPVAGEVGAAVAEAAAATLRAKQAAAGPKDALDQAKKEAAQKTVDYVVGPVRPFEWFQSVNAIFIVLLGPVFTWLWAWLHRRNANPSIPFKFGLGLVQVGLGFVLLLWSFKGADEAGLVPWYMLTGLYLIHTTAELCISPVGLSMVTKLAPASITGMVMGGWFLSIANANFVASQFSELVGSGEVEEGTKGVGALTAYSDAFTPIVWMAVSAGLAILVLSRPVNKLMHGVK